MLNLKTVEEKDVAGGGNYGSFGLNKGQILSVKYSPNGGYKGEQRDALIVEWQIGDTKNSFRFFPIPSDYQYDAEKCIKIQTKRLQDLLEIFVPQETVKKVIETPYNDWKTLYQTVEKCLAVKVGDLSKVDVDIFLQYQLNIGQNAKRTFLEIDNAITSYKGKSYVKHIEGNFKQVVDDNGLHFVTDDGKVHPIARSKWFTEQNYMKLQTLEGSGIQPVSTTNSADLPFGGSEDTEW